MSTVTGLKVEYIPPREDISDEELINNLNACLFYIGCGFEIGGLNTRVYEGTKQEGKSDIYFYLK